jgi:hypothetical protein
MITQEELKALLDYDEVTGVFTWKVNRNNQQVKGKTAGCINQNGYHQLTLNCRTYLGHKLAWLFIYGELPPFYLDHIDGSRVNNSIVNLRKSTKAEYLKNRGKTVRNKSGYKGVSFHKASGKWIAQAMQDRHLSYLGLFNTPEAASLAYQEFALKNHGEFIHNSVSTALAN